MNEKLRILIVDDNQMMAKTLQDIFKVKGYQAEVAYSGSEALEKVGTGNFDCILSDIKMPDINGVELYRAIKNQKPNLPVVLMTAYATDKLVQEGLQEGVIAVLNKPLNLGLLLDFLPGLRRERSVVIVDDDPDFCQTLGDVLQQKGFNSHQITNPEGIEKKIKASEQVVLLNMNLKENDGLGILRKIRAQHPNIPVVMITGYREEMALAIETALEIGAYAYFYKPLQIEALLQVLTDIHHQELGQMLGHPGQGK